MDPWAHLPKSTVIVGGWQSTCNNCHQQTVNFVEHDLVSGYRPKGEPQKKGCGIVFTHITCAYGDRYREGAQEMNPNLTYVSVVP